MGGGGSDHGRRAGGAPPGLSGVIRDTPQVFYLHPPALPTPAAPPPAAGGGRITEIEGGSFHSARRPKAARPRAKSAGLWMALVQTGWEGAGSSRAPPAAGTPPGALWTRGGA